MKFSAMLLMACLFKAQMASADDLPASDSPVLQSDIVLPTLSLLLPGMSQFIHGDYSTGTALSSTALLSAIYSSNLSTPDEEESKEFSEASIIDRKRALAAQTYQTMGGFSLYHGFGLAVRERKKLHPKEYEFLPEDHGHLTSVTMAPFRFAYLKRPTTYIPLLAFGALSYTVARHPVKGWRRDKLDQDDWFYASAYSYQAGTHEEAVFRGWMMPVMQNYGFHADVANGVQATAFALAHLSTNQIPVMQLLGGLYFGNLTQTQHYDLGESIFIHTWWDVIAFLSVYATRKELKSTRHMSGSPMRMPIMSVAVPLP